MRKGELFFLGGGLRVNWGRFVNDHHGLGLNMSWFVNLMENLTNELTKITNTARVINMQT